MAGIELHHSQNRSQETNYTHQKKKKKVMHSLTKNIQYNKKVKQLPISSVSSMLKQAFFNYITNWKLMCKKYCNTLCDQLSFTLQQSCKAVQN